MSTLKRLLNVGKGKVAVARKPAWRDPDEPAAPAAPSDWVDSARHAVADAAEAVAHAVRPEEPAAVPSEATARTPPTREAKSPPPPAEPPPAEPTRPAGPRKRTL